MNKDALNKIVNSLRKFNHINEANDLEKLGLEYYTVPNDEKKQTVYQIKQMCHPKWLGDLYIGGISQKEWYKLLDDLSKSL